MIGIAAKPVSIATLDSSSYALDVVNHYCYSVYLHAAV